MFHGLDNQEEKISKVVGSLTEKKKTKMHGRHIGVKEAKTIFGEKVTDLELDQELQDAVLTVHHISIITLEATPCYKIIENHAGKAYMQMSQAQVVSH